MGGSATWAGTKNPLAVSQAAAYTKFHERTLFADMTLTQDLSSITPGLGASGMLSYDNYANIGRIILKLLFMVVIR